MAAIILAGGLGARMGAEKALLESNGKNLLLSLVTRFAERMGRVIVVLRPGQVVPDALKGVGEAEHLAIVRDVYEGAGPLSGLHAGLAESPDQANFVLGCDMPLANPELALWIVSKLTDHDAAIPMLPLGPEPLHGAYSKRCLGKIESSIRTGRLRIREVLNNLDVTYVAQEEIRQIDPELRSFLNVNTPEDYLQVLKTISLPD
ncbi:MAG: molybdenum cofactor guanylyltransferase [Armatimonadetes bacterium]|nr:molybdenum cofactor guanylyltransferase [Armatimonadota bacterium]